MFFVQARMTFAKNCTSTFRLKPLLTYTSENICMSPLLGLALSFCTAFVWPWHLWDKLGSQDKLQNRRFLKGRILA